ncbi:hypothetical protein BaRGS_00001943 [Batillaria attramentaria]|uniref:Uncharacterized protein n=1 Tax=Batillaria attramentaria TaxID=370345 RepID=A0ABD0M629_9CAEN
MLKSVQFSPLVTTVTYEWPYSGKPTQPRKPSTAQTVMPDRAFRADHILATISGHCLHSPHHMSNEQDKRPYSGKAAKPCTSSMSSMSQTVMPSPSFEGS